MPDTVTISVLSPNLAKNLLVAYRGYLQNQSLEQLANFPLSKTELLLVFDILIKNNPLWEIDPQNPGRYDQVAWHLNNITDPKIKETAAVPSYLEDLTKIASASFEERQIARLVIRQNLDRDIERMRTVYHATQEQKPLDQEQQDALNEATRVVRESRRISSKPSQTEVPSQVEKKTNSIDEIRKWVEQHAKQTTSTPIEEMGFSSSLPKTGRVLRPVVHTTQKDDVDRESKETAKNPLLLAYQREPLWKRIFSQGEMTLGKREETRKIIENSIQEIQIRNPQFYKENFVEIQTLLANLDTLLPPNERIEKAFFALKEDSSPEFKAFKNLVGVKILELNIDPEKNTVGVSLQGKTPNLQLAVSQNTTGLGLKEKTLSVGQNFLSKSLVKLHNLYANPNLGWLRGALGVSLGLGAIITPLAPLKLLLFLGGGSLGIAQISHSPKTASSFVLGASRSLDFLQDFAKLFTNFKFQPIKMAGWIIAVVLILPIALVLLTFNKISNDQSVFLTERTSFGQSADSIYISLTKVATPSSYKGSFPLQVKFTITIGAKEKNLKDIVVTDTFSSFGKGTIPTPQLPGGIIFPTSLTAGETKTITFDLTLGHEYNDSVVTNNITVKANVEDGPQNETASRSAPVVIGDPPTGCFVFASGERNWSETEKAWVGAVVAKMSRYANYMTTLCRDGSISVFRDGERGWGGEVRGLEIHMFDKAFRDNGPFPNLYYTFAHESGHIYARKNGSAYAKFVDSVAIKGEGYIPTYALDFEPNEDFAETIAIYIVRDIIPALSRNRDGSTHSIANMSTKWPIHYQFAKENFFGGQE